MNTAKKILFNSIEQPNPKKQVSLKHVLLMVAVVGFGYWCSVVFQSASASRENFRKHPRYHEFKEAYQRGEVKSSTDWFTYAD